MDQKSRQQKKCAKANAARTGATSSGIRSVAHVLPAASPISSLPETSERVRKEPARYQPPFVASRKRRQHGTTTIEPTRKLPRSGLGKVENKNHQ